MPLRHAVIINPRILRASRLTPILTFASHQHRLYHSDGRNRLSGFWVPTGGIAPKNSSPGASPNPALTASNEKEDITSLLHRASYLRQSHAGIFELLPLGLRVQEKLIRLVDRHIQCYLGASKLELSTFASEQLWNQSGRLATGKQELFKVQDRKGGNFLLSPTHEEKITQLVKGMVGSYKDLPVRVYQVTRKYRDELRPRGGLLRAREFVMKDLYTFDTSSKSALDTYHEVRRTYRKFFADLGVPFLEADADSGAIGGDLSHEFHYPSSSGEDILLKCPACEYTINQERLNPPSPANTSSSNPTSSQSCPKCNKPTTALTSIPAIEVGHTFHLGTRYSLPLNATFAPADSKTKLPIQMGCHGIGISRLIAATAAALSDSRGLNWPRAIAPFECVVIPGKGCTDEDAAMVYDRLRQKARWGIGREGEADQAAVEVDVDVDVILDDRRNVSFPWKMNDADLIGYPVIVLLGKSWRGGSGDAKGPNEGMCEVQCRRLGVRQEVVVEDLRNFVGEVLGRL